MSVTSTWQPWHFTCEIIISDLHVYALYVVFCLPLGQIVHQTYIYICVLALAFLRYCQRGEGFFAPRYCYLKVTVTKFYLAFSSQMAPSKHKRRFRYKAERVFFHFPTCQGNEYLGDLALNMCGSILYDYQNNLKDAKTSL